MVQRQLVDYIKAQIKAGVSKDELRRALLGAGWSETDVDDSINGAAEAAPAVSAPSVSGGPVLAGSPIIVSDLIPNVSKMEVIAAKPEQTKNAASEPKARLSVKLPKPDRKTIIIIVVAVVALGLAGASVYFYMQLKSVEDKLTALSVAGGASDSKIVTLNSQIADLTKTNDDLASQASSLTNANKEFTDELSFFAVPEGSSASSSVSVDFSGVLEGGGKNEYSIAATSGIKVFVGNSKEAAVDAVLKPLLGQTVRISGTHTLSSREVTVTSVNGNSVQ